MKIEISTDKKINNNKPKAHHAFFLFVACVVLVFAALYVHGFIVYGGK